MEFLVDRSSGVAPYRQLTRQVTEVLRLGWLQLGAQLPVVRQAVASSGALILLGVLCTALSNLLYYRTIVRSGAHTAALGFYLAPVSAVTLGVLVLDEKVGHTELAGLVLVIAGSLLAARWRVAGPGAFRQ